MQLGLRMQIGRSVFGASRYPSARLMKEPVDSQLQSPASKNNTKTKVPSSFEGTQKLKNVEQFLLGKVIKSTCSKWYSFLNRPLQLDQHVEVCLVHVFFPWKKHGMPSDVSKYHIDSGQTHKYLAKASFFKGFLWKEGLDGPLYKVHNLLQVNCKPKRKTVNLFIWDLLKKPEEIKHNP